MYNRTLQFNFKSSPGLQGGTVDLSMNIDYQNNKTLWQNCAAVVAGIDEMLACNLIGKHERESETNWLRRKGQLQHLNYSYGILQAYSAHLFRKAPVFNIDPIKEDPVFDMFYHDCDYEGTPFPDLWKENENAVGLYGMVGYIVDAPKAAAGVVSEALNSEVHPYVQTFYPPAILDWQYVRNEFGKPILIFLKVIDDDGFLRCWWDLGDKIHWEVYSTPNILWNGRIITDSFGNFSNKTTGLVDSGDYDPNVMPEIPFVPHYNMETNRRLIGVSDIKDIARCDVNIANRLSDATEIFEFASFPMMRKPYKRVGDDQTDETGASAILEFDPEHPESRPDWLLAPVKDPIDAITQYIDFVRKEIYRISAIVGMEDVNGNATGKALTMRFQPLNSRLVKKANYAGQAMMGILRLEQMWQKKLLPEDVSIQMPANYDIEDLAQDIVDILSAEKFVGSITFSKELQKIVVQKMLPSLAEDVKSEINDEIEAQEEVDMSDQELGPDGLPISTGQPPIEGPPQEDTASPEGDAE